ncbi:hypothetical protein [Streptomyces erythrochromogenes]|uniref:hypothetical protein n=1 Tax=Streptomyces erythrochromogenes TaxID=285574 RepID=UPI0037D54D21
MRLNHQVHYPRGLSRETNIASIQITAKKAGFLQSFPASYPWQGNQSRRFSQIGNAVPPLLAAHSIAPTWNARSPATTSSAVYSGMSHTITTGGSQTHRPTRYLPKTPLYRLSCNPPKEVKLQAHRGALQRALGHINSQTETFLHSTPGAAAIQRPTTNSSHTTHGPTVWTVAPRITAGKDLATAPTTR